MSKIYTKQDTNPHLDKHRFCSRCEKEEITFLNHLSIIARRKKLRGSFELPQLHEILDEFNNYNVEVFCNCCYLFVKYGTCQCQKFRHTKKIETEDSKGNPIYFTVCGDCAYDLFNINYDEYDYRQDTIKLRGRKK